MAVLENSSKGYLCSGAEISQFYISCYLFSRCQLM